jgi:NADH-quinone oxidoreductase subunit M
MRADIAALNARVARAAPEGDARLVLGERQPDVEGSSDAGHAAEPAAPEGAH